MTCNAPCSTVPSQDRCADCPERRIASEKAATDRNAVIEEVAKIIEESPLTYSGPDPQGIRALHQLMVAAIRDLKVTQKPGVLATAQADTLGSGLTGRRDGPSPSSAVQETVEARTRAGNTPTTREGSAETPGEPGTEARHAPSSAARESTPLIELLQEIRTQLDYTDRNAAGWGSYVKRVVDKAIAAASTPAWR